jgi:dolichol-phosphate mannosyltransferase
MQLKQLRQTYSQLQFICLSRNFGKEAAIHAGLQHSHTEDAVIVMDSDLQHPPTLIPQMLHLWQQGISVVEAYKLSRGDESLMSRLLAQGFYYLFAKLAAMDINNQSDFKLLDQKVVAAYCALPERKRFFRGLIHWMGFTSAQIPFEVPKRQHGISAWSRLRLLQFAFTALTTFSTIPLQWVTFFGIVFLLLSLILGSLTLYYKYIGVAVSGFATVILLLLLIGSLLMIALGLIGIYLAHIYEEVKQRPTYLIDWNKSDKHQ